jgi:hypothetical protein
LGLQRKLFDGIDRKSDTGDAFYTALVNGRNVMPEVIVSAEHLTIEICRYRQT